MPREYRKISLYEKEIHELREKGLIHKEIGYKLGFSQEQIKKFLKRYREKQNKTTALSVALVLASTGFVHTNPTC